MENDVSLPPLAAPRRKSGRLVLIVFLLAFLLGGGLIGWLASSGHLAGILPQESRSVQRLGSVATPSTPGLHSPEAGPSDAVNRLAEAEARAAGLEQRLADLELKARAASGTAAHAEDLLVAIAVRRQIERGTPLGYLEDEVKRRFAAIRPEAVQTVLETARRPVSVVSLGNGLEAIEARLASSERKIDGWAQFQNELSELFVIRREGTPRATPSERIERARLLLGEGRIDKAVEEVSHLPGNSGAREWIETAERYARVQRALDLIEESALTVPARPVIAPTQAATPEPAPAAMPSPASGPVT